MRLLFANQAALDPPLCAARGRGTTRRVVEGAIPGWVLVAASTGCAGPPPPSSTVEDKRVDHG